MSNTDYWVTEFYFPWMLFLGGSGGGGGILFVGLFYFSINPSCSDVARNDGVSLNIQ